MIKILRDTAVDSIRPDESVETLASLLELLCGEKINIASVTKEAQTTIQAVIVRCREEGPGNVQMNYEEFNELLLMFNQYRVEKPFFSFFFLTSCQTSDIKSTDKKSISFAALPLCVRQFRGFAMLCFGNFRFAYRRLSRICTPVEFEDALRPWNCDSAQEEKEIKSRKEPLARLVGSSDYISEEKTWYLGYLTSHLLYSDSATLKCLYGKMRNSSLNDVLEEARDDETMRSIIKDEWDTFKEEDVQRYKGKIDALEEEVNAMRDEAKIARATGIKNTVKYLTWDYLDVYVATSMRQEWEFRETHAFVREVFERKLKGFPLRWFDPTQSFDNNLVDKGLLEGLMLKRARCTIYMAQEGDTLGKDSELAATLAQGKPVIAYVREVRELEKEAKELRKRPLRYFRQRLLSLLADLFFDKTRNLRKVSEHLKALGEPELGLEVRPRIQPYLELLYDFQRTRKFVLVSDDEREYREIHKNRFRSLEKFMTAVEAVAADNRAEIIKSRHPLSLQVNLATGVANGVLVVRSAGECARLVKNIMTRSLTFEIDALEKGKDLGTALIEQGSKSKFRVVTKNDCLTNSFWNFYRDPTPEAIRSA